MTQQVKPTKRRRARECAVQALYSWFVSQNTPEKVKLDFIAFEDIDMNGVDLPYFRKLFHETINNLDTLEDLFSPYLDRSIGELGTIERAILSMATYELFSPYLNHSTEESETIECTPLPIPTSTNELNVLQDDVVPYKVVINEAIEVAKVFGAEESHKYINGVLDKLAPQLGRK
ncbi:transcription antitermination protein NusB [Gallibacterium melopsittaci]|uniref:Transcription antitermination protein NusB n=1 Tax=Gallibacterium melopsittaci TaxID=516063 RepID=A0ABV6HVW5_9PAST